MFSPKTGKRVRTHKLNPLLTIGKKGIKMKFKLILLCINLVIYSIFVLLFKFVFIVDIPDVPQLPVPWTEACTLALLLWMIVFGVFLIIGGLIAMPDIIEKAWREINILTME